MNKREDLPSILALMQTWQNGASCKYLQFLVPQQFLLP